MNELNADRFSLNVSTNDSSSASASMTGGEVIALTVLSSGISVIGAISNMLLILAVLMNRKLCQKHITILLINLSFCDFILCTVYVPMYTHDINYGASALGATVRNRMGFALFTGSLNGKLSVTLDRFISICFPYWYVVWITKIRASIVVSVSWFLAIFLTVLSLLKKTTRYSSLYLILALVLIISFHLVMYLVARRQAKMIASQYPPECQKFPFWNKPAKTTAMIISAWLLCWAPIVFLPTIVPPSSPSFKRYIKVVLAFTSLSAVVDPFIFWWRLSDFRSALYTCLRKARRMICQSMN